MQYIRSFDNLNTITLFVPGEVKHPTNIPILSISTLDTSSLCPQVLFVTLNYIPLKIFMIPNLTLPILFIYYSTFDWGMLSVQTGTECD